MTRTPQTEMLNIRMEARKILLDLPEGETIRRKQWERELIDRAKCGKTTAWLVVDECIKDRKLVKRVPIRKGGANHKYCLSPAGRKKAGKQVAGFRKKLALVEAGPESAETESGDDSGRQVFVIRGPYEIPCERLAAGRIIHSSHGVRFWEKAGVAELELRGKIGCYLYALRAGNGYTPFYAGKTTAGFGQECFTDGKLKHYNRALASVKAGTPVLFFVTPDRNARPTKNKNSLVAKAIGEIEKHLIQLASAANPSGLLNTQNVKRTWGIRGMHRGLGGKGNRASAAFRRTLNLDKLTH